MDNLGYQDIAKRSLHVSMPQLSTQQDKASSTARAFLMQQYGWVLLKHQSSYLVKQKSKILKITYPYLLTKALSKANSYLACKIDRCFAYAKRFDGIVNAINQQGNKE